MQSLSQFGSGFNSIFSSSVEDIFIDNLRYPLILVISFASGFANATHKFFKECCSLEYIYSKSNSWIPI